MTIVLSRSTVAVTGGAGLIGSFLVDELVAKGARVIVIDDFSKGLRQNIAHHGESIELREGDLEKPDFAMAALAGCEAVFHLASRAYGVGYAKGRHTEILQHNERITDNILAAVAAHRPKRLLVASSSCVYDDHGPDTIPELPLFDGEPERANLGYGWAKRFLEQKALIYAGETGVAVTIVRPFNIYGERYKWVGEFSQAIPMLVKKILDGDDPVTVWGSGRQRRNYIHAADCARIMLRLIESGHTDGPVNIGTEDTVSLRELVQMICGIAGKTPHLEFDSSKPEGRFVKSADATKLRAVLPDLRFRVDLSEGLQRMVGWYHKTFADQAR
ncbi:MAG: NAD-dependent epimerase/dehydratase family protein [Alphaproteobacteria bacterium]